MTLWHTGQPAHIALCGGIVHHEQTAVARLIGGESSVGYAFAMTVARVTVHT